MVRGYLVLVYLLEIHFLQLTGHLTEFMSGGGRSRAWKLMFGGGAQFATHNSCVVLLKFGGL